MRFSYSSFQAQIRSTSASRPRSWRVFFSSSSSRFSTTAWVAMPAWSVPGIQRASIALHPPPADQDVLERIVQRVAQVQRPGDVRRRDDDASTAASAARRIGVEVALLQPEVVPAALGVLGVVLLGEVGDGHASSSWSWVAGRRMACPGPGRKQLGLTRPAAPSCSTSRRLHQVAHLADVVIHVRRADEEQAEPGLDRRLGVDRRHASRPRPGESDRADDQVRRPRGSLARSSSRGYEPGR